MELDADKSLTLERARAQRRQVNLICSHMGLNVAGLCVSLIARVSILMEASGKSAADSAQLLALFSSGVGAIEFILNPIMGKLSDAYGRKLFLMQAPAVSALLKAFVFLKPSVFTVGLERCLAGACTTIGGSTSCSSALADIYIEDPKELGRAYASLGTATGLGVIVGPIIGGFAIGKSGSQRRAFGAGAVLSALQLLLVSSRISETLPLAQRKPLPKKDMLAALNPLSIFKLFVNGPVVAMLASISSLQCFCEGKCLSDLNTYYLLNDAKFSNELRATYISCLGMVMTAAGIIGRNTIAKLGMRGHTTLQNFASAVGFTLMGSTTEAPLIFGVLSIYAFAMERRAATTALAAKAAAAAGMGKGEFSAAAANLRAIVVGVAPLLYAKVYAQSKATKGSPGRPFFVAALMALISEAMHRCLSDKQLDFK